MISNKLNGYKWWLLFGLWMLHGIIALWQYLPLPENLLDSPYRLIGLIISALWVVLLLTGGLLLGRKPHWLNWDIIASKSMRRDFILMPSFLVLFISLSLWGVYGLSVLTPESRMDDYIRVGLPILGLATFVSLELMALALLHDVKRSSLNPRFLARLFFVLSLLGLCSWVVSLTGLGIVPSYVGDWSRGLPAVPLFEWHIVLAIGFSVAMVLLETNNRLGKFIHLDFAICFFIWMSAALLWAGQPTVPNASALKPHEPNFEIYPFLDSQTYDQLAQSVLIGKGFGGSIPPRALYISFLAIAHALVGQRYEAMIQFQSLIFAFFPVLLYLLGKRFFGRPIGISMAVFAILRDFTSNLVSPFTGNLSYSKVFLSEIPTAMFLVLFLILGIRWIKEEFPAFTGFLMGGVLGLVMLIRTQTVVAFPVILLFAFLVHPRKLKSIVKGSVVMALSLALAVAPWLWRNWQLTGEVIFDSPEFQISNLALRYSRLNGIEPNIVQLPGESHADYNERLSNMAVTAVQSNPQKVAWGVLNTFLNHGINNILLLPLRYELTDLTEFWIPRDAFWEEWTGVPNAVQALLLGFYLFLFGLGVTTAWHRTGWLGLLPLALNLAYNLWSSLALLSGQRFMVTMDWSVYFYYMIGIFALLGGAAAMFTRGYTLASKWMTQNFSANAQSTPRLYSPAWHYALFGALFLFIGGLPPLVERIFPDKYPYLEPAQLLPNLVDSPALEQQTGVNAACLQRLDNTGQLRYLQGRALYPRYYLAGDGEEVTDAIGYKNTNEDRLVFEFIGWDSSRVIFPVSAYPDFFPHASDVILLYGPDATIWFIDVQTENAERFYISSDFDVSLCQ